VLREPRDGVPEPLTRPEQLADLVRALRAGSGPVALDAERASGYRYSQRAYLVQLRRAGVGTALIDPIALPDLSAVGEAIGDAEWILHAAAQDLPCLAELGMTPSRLFDTELAGRLLGDERVALGTMVERHLGVGLEKGHSAADWSTRPLPYEWLAYAALDVELLIDLRNVLADELARAGKTEWAEQEFEAVRAAPGPVARAEPWRRTSGIHRLRNRRQLAVLRSLWTARDEYAAQRDIAPGRVLPDAAMVEAARTSPGTARELAALPVFGGPRQRRRLDRWFGAIRAARDLPDTDLPAVTGGDGMPATTRWRDRDPAAAARLAAARGVVAGVAEEHDVLAQNLLASDVLRRLCWIPPQPITADRVRERLVELGARPWQVELTAGPIAAALAAVESDTDI
jgi:ribonuclease D